MKLQIEILITVDSDEEPGEDFCAVLSETFVDAGAAAIGEFRTIKVHHQSYSYLTKFTRPIPDGGLIVG